MKLLCEFQSIIGSSLHCRNNFLSSTKTSRYLESFRWFALKCWIVAREMCHYYAYHSAMQHDARQFLPFSIRTIGNPIIEQVPKLVVFTFEIDLFFCSKQLNFYPRIKTTKKKLHENFHKTANSSFIFWSIDNCIIFLQFSQMIFIIINC